jgi:hypothetical protein
MMEVSLGCGRLQKREGGTRRWMGEGVEGPEGGRVEDELRTKKM